MRAVLAVLLVWGILYVVPFVVYGSASALMDLKPPAGPAWRFLLSIAVTKLGTAAAFVALFALSGAWRGRWLQYAAIWFVMFAVSEIGDMVKGSYSVPEAALGVFSEAVYTPLSALIVDKMLR